MSTTETSAALARLRAGEQGAEEQLLKLANDHLAVQMRRFVKSFPTVAAWYETGDVRQLALLRLYHAIQSVEISDVCHFHRLIAKKVREVLLDLKRKTLRSRAAGQHALRFSEMPEEGGPWLDVPDETNDPQELAEWLEIHVAIEALPDDQQLLFDLLWYNEVDQCEAARLLGISDRHLRRLWRDARLSLWKSVPSAFESRQVR